MSQQPTAAINSSTGVDARSQQAMPNPTSPWTVTALEVLPGYRLAVSFQDGSHGTVDMSGLIHSPDAGVFAPLKDEQLFAQAHISFGAVTWPGDCPDLAPDAMHKAIAATGEWVA